MRQLTVPQCWLLSYGDNGGAVWGVLACLPHTLWPIWVNCESSDWLTSKGVLLATFVSLGPGGARGASGCWFMFANNRVHPYLQWSKHRSTLYSDTTVVQTNESTDMHTLFWHLLLFFCCISICTRHLYQQYLMSDIRLFIWYLVISLTDQILILDIGLNNLTDIGLVRSDIMDTITQSSAVNQLPGLLQTQRTTTKWKEASTGQPPPVLLLKNGSHKRIAT